MATLNLGRSRQDNPGSQDTILNSIKLGKVALPKFTGKNASELNALAQFILDKISSTEEFHRDLTSSNVDTTLERLHSALLKLKEATDADDQNSYDLIKSDILDQLRSITTDTGKEKPKEVLLSEEDKSYIKDLIAASTLTEATEKTTDQTGLNGLTKDDIDHALDVTIQKLQSLNNDVVDAASKANLIVEDNSDSSAIKDELLLMFSDNKPDGSEIGELQSNNNALFEKLLNLISTQVGKLNTHINIVGENFKNSPVFNYKNPFTSSVGKIPSAITSVQEMFNQLYTKVQEKIEKTSKAGFDISAEFKKIKSGISKAVSNIKFPTKSIEGALTKVKEGITKKLSTISKSFSNFGNSLVDFKKNFKSSLSSLKNNIKKTALSPFKKIGEGLGKIKNAVTLPFKKKKEKKEKPKKKGVSFGKLLSKFKIPKSLAISPASLKTLMLNVKKAVTPAKSKKKKKPGFLSKMIGKITNPAPVMSSKDKKEKKLTSNTFKALNNFMKKVGNIFKNIAEIFLNIFETIVVGIAKALAKVIGIILNAILANPFVLAILLIIGIIAVAILFISLAVKKLVDFVVDDLGPIIKEKLKMIDPKTLNRFINKVSDFIDVFSSLLAGAFAPIIAIGTIIKAAIEPMAEFIKNTLSSFVKHVLPVVDKLFEVISNVILKILEKLEPIIIKIVDIVGGLILTILLAVEPIIKAIQPLIILIGDIVANIIQGAVIAIKAIVDVVSSVISSVWEFLCHPLDFIKKMVNGVKNWLAGFADVEIGAWKFKFRPFGFLKGLKSEDTSDEPIEVKDEKSQQIIDNLFKQLKEVKTNYSNSLKLIQTLQDKLKEASSIKIDKRAILNMQASIRTCALTLRKSILPMVKNILSNQQIILKSLKTIFNKVKNISKGKIRKIAKTEKPNKLAAKTAVTEVSKKKLGFFDRIKNTVASKNPLSIKTITKKNSEVENKTLGLKPILKVSLQVNKIEKPKQTYNVLNLGTTADVTGGKGILITRENRELHLDKIKAINDIMSGKTSNTKLQITQESVKDQFSSIDNINSTNNENMLNMANSFTEIENEHEDSEEESEDISNIDLKAFLEAMFANVDINFLKINKKLDTPQVIPTTMNINNQALMGIN